MEQSTLLLLKNTLPLQNRAEELDALIAAPEIIADNRLYRRLTLERAGLQDAVVCRQALAKSVQELQAIASSPQPTGEEMLYLLATEEKALKTAIRTLTETLAALVRPEDSGSQVLLDLFAGDGGETAARFCTELVEMYKAYAVANGWDIDIRSASHAAGGYKKISCLVSGFGVWSRLQGENGLHRAMGLDGGKRTAGVFVLTLSYTPYISAVPADKDIRVDIYHSGGAGGQNINKVETAVRMTHLPTGISVTCQDERSQLKNRDRAYQNLIERLDSHFRKENEAAFDKEKKRRLAEARQGENLRNYDYLQNRVTAPKTGQSAPLDVTLAEGPCAFEDFGQR